MTTDKEIEYKKDIKWMWIGVFFLVGSFFYMAFTAYSYGQDYEEARDEYYRVIDERHAMAEYHCNSIGYENASMPLNSEIFDNKLYFMCYTFGESGTENITIEVDRSDVN